MYLIRFLIAIGIFLVLLAGIPRLGMANGIWDCIRKEVGVEVYARKNTKKGTPVFKGIIVLNQRIEIVAQRIIDIGTYDQWIEDCLQVTVLNQTSAMSCKAYMVLDSPWPIANREVVYDIQAVIDKESSRVDIFGVAIVEPHIPVRDGYLRISDAEYHVTLIEIAPGKTQVLYQSRIDLGGNITEFMTEYLIGNLVFDSLQNLRALTEKVNPSQTQNRFVRQFNRAEY
jgi:hypothetical protein